MGDICGLSSCYVVSGKPQEETYSTNSGHSRVGAGPDSRELLPTQRRAQLIGPSGDHGPEHWTPLTIQPRVP